MLSGPPPHRPTPFHPARFAKLQQMMGLPLLCELVAQYAVSSAHHLQKMRTAARDGNIKLLHRLAHSTKGSSGSLSATTLSELCQTLEKDTQSGHLAQAEQRVEQIAQAQKDFFDALQVEIDRMKNNNEVGQ